MAGRSDDSVCGCKVGRVAADRKLSSTVTRIESARQQRDASLRQLECEFNRTVLGAALEAEGYTPLDGEVDNLYRLLTEDDVTGGMRVQARNRLEDHGVDIEAVQADFVSYQTINRHFKQCRGFTQSTENSGISMNGAEDRLFALRTRALEVSSQTVGQLDRSEVIDIGEFDVNVDIGVTCLDCGTQASFTDLFSGWRCECDE